MISYITALGILLITFLVAWLFNRSMKRFIIKATTEMENDPTNYQFLRHAISALIYLIGNKFWLSIDDPYIEGIGTITPMAGAGIAAVAIGFASQAALANIVAGKKSSLSYSNLFG